MKMRNHEPATLRGRTKPSCRVSRAAFFWLGMLAMLMLGFGSRAAFADGVTCTGTAGTVSISMPASVTVPRNAANGTLLTGWTDSPLNASYYTCTTVNGAAGMGFEPVSLSKTPGLTVTGPDKTKYTVWDTNLPGVGVAIGVTPYFGGIPRGSRDLGYSDTFPSPWSGTPVWSVTPNRTVGGMAQVALVKTGAITPGTVTGGTLFEGTVLSHIGNGPYSPDMSKVQSFSLTPTIINVAACTTPDVTVDMGNYKLSAFKGIGSTTPGVPVKVSVNDCPAGLKSIQYQFIPLGTVLDATNGVFALSGDSTATGIGLQLKDSSNGATLQYNKQYVLTNYNSSTGGSYTIPLTASYYQTSSKVTGGTANAVLTFTMTYQ